MAEIRRGTLVPPEQIQMGPLQFAPTTTVPANGGGGFRNALQNILNPFQNTQNTAFLQGAGQNLFNAAQSNTGFGPAFLGSFFGGQALGRIGDIRKQYQGAVRNTAQEMQQILISDASPQEKADSILSAGIALASGVADDDPASQFLQNTAMKLAEFYMEQIKKPMTASQAANVDLRGKELEVSKDRLKLAQEKEAGRPIKERKDSIKKRIAALRKDPQNLGMSVSELRKLAVSQINEEGFETNLAVSENSNLALREATPEEALKIKQRIKEVIDANPDRKKDAITVLRDELITKGIDPDKFIELAI